MKFMFFYIYKIKALVQSLKNRIDEIRENDKIPSNQQKTPEIIEETPPQQQEIKEQPIKPLKNDEKQDKNEIFTQTSHKSKSIFYKIIKYFVKFLKFLQKQFKASEMMWRRS